MKIIQANKFLYPKGGADKYCLVLIEELEKSGHEVIPYGMSDTKNISSPYSTYFSENINYHQTGNRLKIIRRIIWNKEAAKKFGKLLDDTKPDIIHCHNIYHQLSPSILKEGKKRNIPIVMTLHDYKLICPNYKMFSNGQICERCLKGNFWNCAKHKCYDSYSKSFLASLESWLHNKVWQVYKKNVDIFIAPSLFLKKKMIQGGWNEKNIIVLNNPAPAFNPQKQGENLLYFGRLSAEKGIHSLIEALRLSKENLDIIGSGPEEKSLKELSKKLGLEKRINFYKEQGGSDLDRSVSSAKAIILPSIWNENMPLVLLESLAKGKIIIASNTGGTPELIEEAKTGFLFEAKNIQSLAKKINDLNYLDLKQKESLQENIKYKIEPISLDKHLEKLINIYSTLKNR